MASIGKKKQLLGYAHAFLVAAEGHATAAKQQGYEGEVDGMMCIIALQNSVVGATKVLGKGHVAVKACRKEVPDLKAVRGMLTHFDEYAVGKGILQKSTDGKQGPFGWMPMWNSDETMMILNRRKGEREPRVYEVPIQKALNSVALLLNAAAESLQVKPSALLLQLTSGSDETD